MRPQDIEKIATALVGALRQTGGSATGCQGSGDPETFACDDFSCIADYECGGLAVFDCDNPEPGFDCSPQFSCDDMFRCLSTYSG